MQTLHDSKTKQSFIRHIIFSTLLSSPGLYQCTNSVNKTNFFKLKIVENHKNVPSILKIFIT